MTQLLDRIIALFVRRPPVGDEDARLARLAAEIMPSPRELREIRAKTPLSTINHDDEPDQPF